MYARIDEFKHTPSFRIIGIYLALAASWIVLTDRFLSDHQTLKGLAFIIISGLLMGYLIFRAWQAYERSEKRFQAVVERAGDIISIVDREGKRRYHSPAIADILGYSPEDLVDRSIFEFVHPDDLAEARELLRNIENWPGSTATIEVRVFRADNALRYLRVTGTNLLDDPAVNGIVLNTRDVTERRQADRQLERQLHLLGALHAIDMAILGNQDLEGTLDVVLEQVRATMPADAARILLCDPAHHELAFARGSGFRGYDCPVSHTSFGDHLAGQAALAREPQIVPRIDQAGHGAVCPDAAGNEGFVGYVAIPLIAKDETKGVLELFSRSELEPASEWLSFVTSLATQAAIAVDSAQLFASLKQANDELELTYDRTLEGWARALELRDDETEGHSRRVVDLTLHLGRSLGVEEDELVHMRRGALLHDIGKIGIPDTILLKPGPLNASEWEIMRRHPLYAYDLLKSIPYFGPALEIPRYHHERWDGSGYPYGLKGRDIPLTARIFAVVDAYDALTSDRPYRKAWSREAALEYLQQESGKLFDPEICRHLLEFVASDQAAPAGSGGSLITATAGNGNASGA